MTDTLFACRYRKRGEIAITLLMDHAKAEWTEACNAAFRHLRLERDLAMERRLNDIMEAREKCKLSIKDSSNKKRS